MKTVGVGELRAQLTSILNQVENGESIEITFGKDNQSRALLVPSKKKIKKPIKLGLLEGMGKVYFADDFKMTEEEFLGL